MVLLHIFEFLICFSCFRRCLVAACGLCRLGIMVCLFVVLLQQLLVYGVIQTKKKHIQLDRDKKSNYDRSYIIELKAYVRRLVTTITCVWGDSNKKTYSIRQK